MNAVFHAYRHLPAMSFQDSKRDQVKNQGQTDDKNAVNETQLANKLQYEYELH